MEPKIDLNEQESDALKEIANIGAGNASKALSQMTDQKIDVTFPQIEFKEVGEIPGIFQDPEEEYIVIIVQVEVEKDNGDTEMMGTQLLLMNREGGKHLAQYLTGQEDTGEQLTEMEKSALKETGNILSGSCLTAITKYVNLTLKEGIPVMEQNQLGNIIDEVIMETNHTEDNTALIFGTEFQFEEKLQAYFLFLFQPGQEKLITDKLV